MTIKWWLAGPEYHAIVLLIEIVCAILLWKIWRRRCFMERMVPLVCSKCGEFILPHEEFVVFAIPNTELRLFLYFHNTEERGCWRKFQACGEAKNG